MTVSMGSSSESWERLAAPTSMALTCRVEEPSTAKPGTTVDVAPILDKLAASNKEKLDWRQ